MTQGTGHPAAAGHLAQGVGPQTRGAGTPSQVAGPPVQEAGPLTQGVRPPTAITIPQTKKELSPSLELNSTEKHLTLTLMTLLCGLQTLDLIY